MASKMSALQSALDKAATPTSKKVVSLVQTPEITEETIQPQPLKAAKPRKVAAAIETPAEDRPKIQASRVGKIHIGGYFSPDVKKSLMMVRAQTGMTESDAIAAALNDLFRAHNVPVVDMK